MDDPNFLLLGLLKGQRQHGYQLNEFIRNNLQRFITLKKATAYSVLDRLLAQGLILEESEQVGNRPLRKVYSLSGKGEAEFERLLRENLSRPAKPEFFGDLGLIFINHLVPGDALALLRERQAALAEGLEGMKRVPRHDGVIGPDLHGVDLAVSRQAALMEADLAWLEGAIARLEARA